ncbi:cupin domain-containing protein [Amaricoccus macauensis]|uniref:cupin domain-containing protein n=1 Tax=Amaricoccus macauensis TaxID=57001 RepID=UPI003C7CD990
MPPDWLLPGPVPPEFATDELCHITELLNDPACPEVSLARARVEPGVTTRLHRVMATAERYVITQGTGLVEIDGESREVRAGDRVLIPPGAAQRITNTGAQDLIFDCICTPRFDPAAYIDIDRAK